VPERAVEVLKKLASIHIYLSVKSIAWFSRDLNFRADFDRWTERLRRRGGELTRKLAVCFGERGADPQTGAMAFGMLTSRVPWLERWRSISQRLP
jgi:hypothetical protein